MSRAKPMNRAWMPFYFQDYVADTAHLSTLEHGAYFLLIGHYWMHGGLPVEDERLARITRLSLKRWRSVRETLKSFFHEGWKHKRIDAEILHASDIIEKRSLAAKQMHSKRTANAHANAEQGNMQNACKRPDNYNNLNLNQDSSDSSLRSESASVVDFPTKVSDKEIAWREIVPLLVKLGVPEKQARSLTGKWFGATGNDYERVRCAVIDAQGSPDPVPFITRLLAPKPVKSKRQQIQDEAHAAALRGVI